MFLLLLPVAVAASAAEAPQSGAAAPAVAPAAAAPLPAWLTGPATEPCGDDAPAAPAAQPWQTPEVLELACGECTTTMGCNFEEGCRCYFYRGCGFCSC